MKWKNRKQVSLPKKNYQSPKLIVFGDMSQITRAVSNRGRRDGGYGWAHGWGHHHS